MVYFCKSLVCPIEHHPLHEHNLYFCNLDNGWVCDMPEKIGGCRRNIKEEYQSYSIPRFRCHECNFDLCDLCAKYKSHSYVNHPWHSHPLYRCYVDDGWICEGRIAKGGCRSYIIDFNQSGLIPRYRCDECDYDLCDKCMKFGLPNFVDLDDIENEGRKITMPQLGNTDKMQISEIQVEKSKDINFENIDNNELMKFFDKSVPLEPFRNSNLSVEEEEETIKKEEMSEKNTVVYDIHTNVNENLCIICCEKPKNVALIHGDTAHLVCCEECSRKIFENICPLCRLPIEFITKYVYIKESTT